MRGVGDRDQCDPLEIHPPGDSMPILGRQGWGFSASTRDDVNEPDDARYYADVTVVRNDDTYVVVRYQDDFSFQE